jgi:hypothetical protein
LLTPSRRVYHRWRPVLPLYDGRECPDCGAPICGREARRLHREDHMARHAWEEWVTDTLMQLAKWTGHPVVEPEDKGAPGEGEGYGRVDLKVSDDDDFDEEDDE